jgi:hypothetical protein
MIEIFLINPKRLNVPFGTLYIKLKFLWPLDCLKKFNRAQSLVSVHEMNIATFSGSFFSYFRSKFESQFFRSVVLRKNYSENFLLDNTTATTHSPARRNEKQ